MIYISKNKYKAFFTLNGIELPYSCNFTTIKKITPMIGFDFSAIIIPNFGTKNFMFDFSKYINSYVISTTNSFINNNFKLDSYEYSCNKIPFTLNLPG